MTIPPETEIAKVDCEETKDKLSDSKKSLRNEKWNKFTARLRFAFISFGRHPRAKSEIFRWVGSEVKWNWWNPRLWVDFSPTGFNQEKPRDFEYFSVSLTCYLFVAESWDVLCSGTNWITTIKFHRLAASWEKINKNVSERNSRLKFLMSEYVKFLDLIMIKAP